jgi:hypothetical protein
MSWATPVLRPRWSDSGLDLEVRMLSPKPPLYPLLVHASVFLLDNGMVMVLLPQMAEE